MPPQRKRQRKDIDAGTSKSENPESIHETTKAVTKRVRRGARPRGKLRGIVKMPLDVFVEIASFLGPLDILHLVGTSRFFRDMFMSKQSRLVWRAAWNNVSAECFDWDADARKWKRRISYAPQCQPGMSEPLLATLVFENGYCTACGRRTSNSSNFVLRMRLCKDCPVANLQTGDKLLSDVAVEVLTRANLGKFGRSDYILFTMVPSLELGQHVWKKDDSRNVNVWDKLSKNLYVTSQFSTVAKRYFEMSLADDPDLKDFVKEKRREVDELLEHAAKLNQWASDREEERRRTNVRLTEIFTKSVHTELFKLGYTNKEFELEKLSLYQRKEFRDLITQSKQLTPRVWTNLRPKLEALLSSNREVQHQIRLQKRRSHISQLIKPRISELTDEHGNVVDPRLYALASSNADLLDFAPVKEFLDEKMKDEEYDRVKTLSEEDWTRLLACGLRGALEKRRDAAARAIFHLLVRGISGLSVREVYNLINKLPSDSDPASDYDAADLLRLKRHSDKHVPALASIPVLFNLFHPAAFLCTDTCRGPHQDNKLLSYNEIYDILHMEQKQFGELMKSAELPTRYCSKIPTWIGVRTVMEIAIALLEGLGYEPVGRGIDTSGSGVVRKPGCCGVTMKDMLAKGAVFVCLCCPEEGRVKRGWKDLVEHFYAEAIFAERAREAMSKNNSSGSISNAHEIVPKAESTPGTQSTAKTRAQSLAVETEPDANSVINGPCPLGIDHTHDDTTRAPGYKLYTCTICSKIFGGRTRMEYKWLQCAKVHAKTRHGEVGEGSIELE